VSSGQSAAFGMLALATVCMTSLAYAHIVSGEVVSNFLSATAGAALMYLYPKGGSNGPAT
jgi:hypothetical protein